MTYHSSRLSGWTGNNDPLAENGQKPFVPLAKTKIIIATRRTRTIPGHLYTTKLPPSHCLIEMQHFFPFPMVKCWSAPEVAHGSLNSKSTSLAKATTSNRKVNSPDAQEIYLTQGKLGYCNFGSIIFKYLTWIPLVVKYGISNLTLIGLFFLSGSASFTLGSPSSALIKNSFPPPNCLIFQMIADFSGA